MRHLWILAVAVGFMGCATGGDGDDTSSTADEQSDLSLSSNKLLYFYASPDEPGSLGFGRLPLRRANAKATTLKPEYGYATLPKLTLASDAMVTQAELDAILAIPYQGHENSVVALIGGRDKSSLFGDPTIEIVELYTPSQPITINDVAQKDALYRLTYESSTKVTAHLVNEKDYDASTASSLSYDVSASADPTAARVAVKGGALFTGKIDVSCHKFVFWTSCDPPSGVHVISYFAAN